MESPSSTSYATLLQALYNKILQGEKDLDRNYSFALVRELAMLQTLDDKQLDEEEGGSASTDVETKN